MTRIEVLNDTIKYFWGSKERQCLVNNGCQYKATETSEGCAIGRLLTPELAASLPQDSGVSSDNVFYSLPLWLKELGQDFLENLQDLHDQNDFVNENKGAVYRSMYQHLDINKIIFPN
jgi:hypothetical protein